MRKGSYLNIHLFLPVPVLRQHPKIAFSLYIRRKVKIIGQEMKTKRSREISTFSHPIVLSTGMVLKILNTDSLAVTVHMSLCRDWAWPCILIWRSFRVLCTMCIK
jgi:hypothetical protein